MMPLPRPDWNTPVKTLFRYRTNIKQNLAGGEIRTSNYRLPKLSTEYSCLVDQAEALRLEQIVGAGECLVPLWGLGAYAGNVSIGQQVSDCEFPIVPDVGQALIFADKTSLVVSSYLGRGILSFPITRPAYEAMEVDLIGAAVAPAYPGKVADLQIQWHSATVGVASIKVEVFQPVDLELFEAPVIKQLLNGPIVEVVPDFDQPVSATSFWGEEFSGSGGVSSQHVIGSLGSRARSAQYAGKRESMMEILASFISSKGSHGLAWFPDHTRELDLPGDYEAQTGMGEGGLLFVEGHPKERNSVPNIFRGSSLDYPVGSWTSSILQVDPYDPPEVATESVSISPERVYSMRCGRFGSDTLTLDSYSFGAASISTGFVELPVPDESDVRYQQRANE